MDRRASRRTRGTLLAISAVLAVLAGATAQLPTALGLSLHEPEAPALNAVVWTTVGALWLATTARHATSIDRLWRLPSALFRTGLLVGGILILAGHAAARIVVGPAPASILSALEAALFELGVVALASLGAFASTRSVLRPVIAGTPPPLGARDIALRTRVLVATMGASFATAGILLNVLLDFEVTAPAQLAAYLATGGALVLASALIGWLVGGDAAQSVEEVTRRMRDLAHDPSVPTEVPVIAADEMGDLIVAANELERRIRREEALAAATAERERIARELHDGVAKSVSVLSLELASLGGRVPSDLRPPLARAEHLARVLADELRAIVQQFRARTDGEPFAQTVRRTVAAHPGADIEIVGDLERLEGLARFEVLRVLDEALRNAERHADASRSTALLSVDDHALRLTVEDDGRGIGTIRWSDLASQGHFGLLGMRERAALLDGELRIEPRATGGTRLSLEIPMSGGTP